MARKEKIRGRKVNREEKEDDRAEKVAKSSEKVSESRSERGVSRSESSVVFVSRHQNSIAEDNDEQDTSTIEGEEVVQRRESDDEECVGGRIDLTGE